VQIRLAKIQFLQTVLAISSIALFCSELWLQSQQFPSLSQVWTLFFGFQDGSMMKLLPHIQPLPWGSKWTLI